MKRLRFYWRARKFLRKWDPAEIRAMLGILKPGDVAFDVGCHKGGWLYWMRRAVGPTGQVYAFEPQPELAAYLTDIVQAFGWQNVFVHTCALGSGQGHSTLHVPDSTGATSASASLVPEVASSEARESADVLEVEIQSLDGLVQRLGLKRLDFLKVDVEGFEWDALEGAKETLAKLQPSVMVESEERHLRPTHRNTAQVFDQVLVHGYEGYFFPMGGKAPLREFDASIHQNEEGPRFWDRESYANNFLFTPKRIAAGEEPRSL
ncbi:MAG: FkbM family methyltransferase [Planctomycetota bacterium]|nr:FkbM family methyltransferase [Planctomycetota bacterium]